VHILAGLTYSAGAVSAPVVPQSDPQVHRWSAAISALGSPLNPIRPQHQLVPVLAPPHAGEGA